MNLSPVNLSPISLGGPVNAASERAHPLQPTYSTDRVSPPTPRNRHERRALEAKTRKAARQLRALHAERHELQRARRLRRPFDAARLAELLGEIDRLNEVVHGPWERR